MISASRLVAHIRCSLTLSACAGAGRRSLAVAAANPGLLRLSSPPPTTTGYYHAAVPTCQSLRQVVRRPLTIVSPPRIVVGTATSRRLMSSSGPQYFEGLWYEKYLLLEEYKKEHGNCLVPQSFVYCGAKLGRWVSKQRQLYKNEKISKNRREMLDVLGFSWDPKGDKWERNFALLEQFKEREGHCNVPNSHEEDGIKLGTWLDWQRQVRKGNRGGNLSSERIERLEALGVVWDIFEDQWERNFVLLEHFKEREGHCNVPALHEEDGINIGKWIDRQRQVKKGNVSGNLSSEQIERLESLGMIWESWEDQWERKFALLEQFKEREGHCNVPALNEEDGINLGKWLYWQRQVKKGNVRGDLSSERIERLENLGVRW